MRKLLYLRNKKGILTGTVMFIILNLVFFSMLLYFANQSISGLDIKEKILAKQVALFINSAKPETLMIFDIKEYLDAAENKLNTEEIIKIEEGKVKVKLDDDTFVLPHFSSYKIEYKVYGNFLEVSVK